MIQKVYLYTRFERFWHWFQALLVLILLLTGFEIHGNIDLFGYELAVRWHDISAYSLFVLFVFAVFWHATTGQWKHYVPIREKLIEVCSFYVKDIFKGACHPFEKHPERKLNPLQRLVYLFLKAVIFPLQFVTGFIYLYPDWFRAKGIAISTGQIAFLHTAGAFFMLIFLIFHCYLITTGRTPLSHLKGMITGWEEIEINEKRT